MSRPSGSSATLSGTTGPAVQITPDVAGDYIVQLMATDLGGLAVVDTILSDHGKHRADRRPPVRTRGRNGDGRATLEPADDPDNGALTLRLELPTKPTGSDAEIDVRRVKHIVHAGRRRR